MSAPRPARPASSTSTGHEDGLGRRALIFDRAEGVALERLTLRPEFGIFEAHLRDRAARLAGWDDGRVARTRRVHREAVDGALLVDADFPHGDRLADILAAPRDGATDVVIGGVDLAIGFLLDVLPALDALHREAQFAHGAIAPGRLLLTGAGRVVLLDPIFGDAIARVGWSRARMWRELGLAASAGSRRATAASDIAQAGVTALMLLLGRSLRDDEYPDGFVSLRAEAVEIAEIQGNARFATAFGGLIDRAVFGGAGAFASAADAERCLLDVADTGMGAVACAAALRGVADSMSQVPARATGPGEPRAKPEKAEPTRMREAPPRPPPLELRIDVPVVPVRNVGPPAAPVPPGYPVSAPAREFAEQAATREAHQPALAAMQPAEPAPQAVSPAAEFGPVDAPPAEVPVAAASPAATAIASPLIPVAAAPAAETPLAPRTEAAVPEAAAAAVPTLAPIEVAGSAPAPAPAKAPAPASGKRRKREKRSKDGLRSKKSPPAPPPAAARPAPPVAPPPAPPVAPQPFFPPAGSYGAQAGPYVPPVPAAPAPYGAGDRAWHTTAPAHVSAGPNLLQAPAASIGVKSPAPLRLKKDDRPTRTKSRQMAPVEEPAEAFHPVGRREHRPTGRGMPWWAVVAAVVVVVAGAVAGRAYLTERHDVLVGSDTLDTPLAAPATTGSIVISSTPEGARVLLDGQLAGVTPLTLDDVAPGRRVVTFVASAGTVQRTVTVKAGESALLDVAVISGWLAVDAPIVLEVVQNGRVIGSTQQNRLLMPPGKHTVSLSNSELGYRAAHVVTIEPGEEHRLSVTPATPVSLNASPWAEVWIDGKRVGETPIANVRVTLGTREIVFRHPDLGERRLSPTIKVGDPTAISVDFSRPQPP